LLERKRREISKVDVVGLQDQTGISLERLTSTYSATLDSPTADLYQEMMQLYPDSLVILSVRDSDDQWWASWYSTLGKFFDRSTILGRLRRLLLRADWSNASGNAMIDAYTAIWETKYGSYGPSVHARHNAHVQQYTPQNRLLVFNVKQGWGPLCQFLSVDVPDVPFPRW
jgi:hypothetical protein